MPGANRRPKSAPAGRRPVADAFDAQFDELLRAFARTTTCPEAQHIVQHNDYVQRVAHRQKSLDQRLQRGRQARRRRRRQQAANPSWARPREIDNWVLGPAGYGPPPSAPSASGEKSEEEEEDAPEPIQVPPRPASAAARVPSAVPSTSTAVPSTASAESDASTPALLRPLGHRATPLRQAMDPPPVLRSTSTKKPSPVPEDAPMPMPSPGTPALPRPAPRARPASAGGARVAVAAPARGPVGARPMSAGASFQRRRLAEAAAAAAAPAKTPERRPVSAGPARSAPSPRRRARPSSAGPSLQRIPRSAAPSVKSQRKPPRPKPKPTPAPKQTPTPKKTKPHKSAVPKTAAGPPFEFVPKTPVPRQRVRRRPQSAAAPSPVPEARIPPPRPVSASRARAVAESPVRERPASASVTISSSVPLRTRPATAARIRQHVVPPEALSSPPGSPVGRVSFAPSPGSPAGRPASAGPSGRARPASSGRVRPASAQRSRPASAQRARPTSAQALPRRRARPTSARPMRRSQSRPKSAGPTTPAQHQRRRRSEQRPEVSDDDDDDDDGLAEEDSTRVGSSQDERDDRDHEEQHPEEDDDDYDHDLDVGHVRRQVDPLWVRPLSAGTVPAKPDRSEPRNALAALTSLNHQRPHFFLADVCRVLLQHGEKPDVIALMRIFERVEQLLLKTSGLDASRALSRAARPGPGRSRTHPAWPTRVLRLSLPACQLGDEGAEALAAALCRSVQASAAAGLSGPLWERPAAAAPGNGDPKRKRSTAAEAVGLAPSDHLLGVDARYNAIGDRGAAAIAKAVAAHRGLTALDLRCNLISAAGAQLIAEAVLKRQQLALLCPDVPPLRLLLLQGNVASRDQLTRALAGDATGSGTYRHMFAPDIDGSSSSSGDDSDASDEGEDGGVVVVAEPSSTTGRGGSSALGKKPASRPAAAPAAPAAAGPAKPHVSSSQYGGYYTCDIMPPAKVVPRGYELLTS